MTDCTVSGNTAAFSGGGVYNYGSLTMSDCTVSGNRAYRAAADNIAERRADRLHRQRKRCHQRIHRRRWRVKRPRHGHADQLHPQGNSASYGGGLYNSFMVRPR